MKMLGATILNLVMQDLCTLVCVCIYIKKEACAFVLCYFSEQTHGNKLSGFDGY
jgi:hypothetical protein